MWLVASGLGVAVIFTVVQWLLLTTQYSDPALGTTPNNRVFVYLIGVPLDDVYIHCRYVSNLLHGFAYSFNPGQTLTADTSPLWVILITISGLFTNRLELVAVALSIVAYLIIGPGIYRTARDVFSLGETNARLAGCIGVLCSRLAWSAMSGMETALAALLMLLIIEEHERSRQRKCLQPREAIWLGLGLLVRPEFMFITLVIVADWCYLAVKKQADVKASPVAIPLLLAIASPAFLLPLATRNSLASHSSVVQGLTISWIPNVQYLWFALKVLASNNAVLFLLLISGLWWLKNDAKYRIPFIVILGLPILQAFVAPQFRQHGRYFFPVFPILVILGLAAWQSWKERTYLWKPAIKLVPVLLIIAASIETGRWAIIESESVRNINDQHLAVVNWLETNIQPNDTLAVDDVGAIGYYLNRPIIDLTGLVTPALWPLQHNQDSVWRAARTMGANLFVIYNRLNPAFYQEHKDSLLLQRAFPVRLPLTSAADTVMSIYRLKGARSGS